MLRLWRRKGGKAPDGGQASGVLHLRGDDGSSNTPPGPDSRYRKRIKRSFLAEEGQTYERGVQGVPGLGSRWGRTWDKRASRVPKSKGGIGMRLAVFAAAVVLAEALASCFRLDYAFVVAVCAILMFFDLFELVARVKRD